MLNWNQIEQSVKDKNQNSGYMNHILSSIKVKSFEIKDADAFLKLAVPSMIVKEICEREIHSEIESYVTLTQSKNLIIEYIIESTQQSFPIDMDENHEVTPTEKAPTHFEFKQKYALNKKMTFDDLVITNENSFAQKALKMFAEDSDIGCAAIFGSSGAGKTHLLHALGWHFLSTKANIKIKVVSGDEFINDFQTAIFSKSMGQFRDKYRLKTDVLLIDDLQTIERAKGTQGELFNLLNEFAQKGKKIIITSDRQISELAGFEDRLKSRFLGGLVLNLELPSARSKMLYLDTKLSRLGVNLDSESMEAVFSNLGNCYRSVDGAVGRIHMLYKINGHADKEAILKMFPLLDKKVTEKLSIDKVIEDIATKHNLTTADLIGKSRKKEVYAARKESIKFIRENFSMSLKDIGRKFNRDHTSIINALNG